MMKILIIYEKMHTTIEVNLSYLNEVLSDYEKRYARAKDVTKEDLEWCDICYAIRPNSIYSQSIVKAIVNSGRFFVSSYDDDVLNLPLNNSSRWKKKYALNCIINSSAIISCSPLIISDYQKIVSHKPFILINSHVKPTDIKEVESPSSKVHFVYVAGKDHAKLFEEFIKPSVDNLFECFGDRIEFTLIGVSPNLENLKNAGKITVYETMPYNEYKDFMMNHHFDIGLAPLHDTYFANRKYFNKFIEYSKYGIIGLYSNVMPYTFVVKQKYNGILVDNLEQEWKNALVFAIEHIEEIKNMVAIAQQQLIEDFTLAKVKEEIDSLFNSMLNEIHKVVTYKKNYSTIVLFEITNIIYIIWTHVKEDGFFFTLKRILKTAFRHVKN